MFNKVSYYKINKTKSNILGIKINPNAAYTRSEIPSKKSGFFSDKMLTQTFIAYTRSHKMFIFLVQYVFSKFWQIQSNVDKYGTCAYSLQQYKVNIRSTYQLWSIKIIHNLHIMKLALSDGISSGISAMGAIMCANLF